MTGSTETIGLRKDASIRNGSDSMRHGRGPGYKRKLRKDARLARTKQELDKIVDKRWLELHPKKK